MAPAKIWLSWSSGKDSAWALHQLRASSEFEVVALLTTINRDAGRVAMHGCERPSSMPRRPPPVFR
jgi:diphthamide synthase (EF-2-diphthine--ammonia ligase)